jgi:hypothetical protein
LTTNSRPTYLHEVAPAPGVNEVQRITLQPAEEFAVIVSPTLTPQQIENEEFEEPGQSTRIEPGETAAEVQSGLESVTGYGTGNVEVQAEGSESYVVTFIAGLGERPVALMGLGYPHGRGKVSEITAGKSSGAGQNEVQQLTVSEAAEFSVIVSPNLTPEQVENEDWEGPGQSTRIEFGESAAAAQAGLESIDAYGPGSLEVQAEGDSYKVTFIGPLAEQPVALLRLGYPAGRGKVSELTPGSSPTPDGEVFILAENLGTANVDGSKSTVSLRGILPSGLRAVAVVANKPNKEGDFHLREPLACKLATLTCTLEGPLAPYDVLEMRIGVDLEGAQSGEPIEARISGGAAAPASLRRPIVVSAEPTPFAVNEFEMDLEEDGGAPVTHAAVHPFQFTTQIALNQGRDVHPFGLDILGNAIKPEVLPVGLAKDVNFNLPPGLIGNPSPFLQCTTAQFFTAVGQGDANECPADSVVGVTTVTVHEPSFAGTADLTEPIFNLEPSFGEPARFGFDVVIANAQVFIDTAVRSGVGGDYGVTATTRTITQTAAFLSASATFWGVPGDPRHDGQRGWGCLLEARHVGEEAVEACRPNTEKHPPVLFSMPTSCASPLATSLDYNSWDDRALRHFQGIFSPSGVLGGCNQVPFGPTIEAEPTSNAATSPTGLNFDIDVNDEGLENSKPGALVQSQIKRAVVTLPEGFTTNPSVAEGLKACSQAQYESETVNGEPGEGCPNESKVGDVEIESPLIESNGIKERVVKGSLYVAQQSLNPNHNLLTLYLVAKNREIGVLVRQALRVTPNPLTGQLVTEVDNIPQLPFSHFRLSFRQGQRSPLVTPSTCGNYTVTADLYPYSEPGTPLHRESSFAITQGPEGQGCPSGGVPPFHPGLEAGTQNNAAGTYSPFYTHITRKDSEQEITRFSIKLPPGVIGKLAGVSSCSDAQIAHAKALEVEGGGGLEEASPSCPKNSEVGHSLVGSGVGNVLAYAPGKLYLAGPYHGSNISLVSITAAKVGPFDLGTVVVRFALRIDPETAEVFVDSQGSDPIPHIVDGIPVHLRDIRAYVDRKDFTLNPTSCQKKSTASTILGSGLNFASEADDQPVTVTSPFQAADCANLGFGPKLGLSLKGGTKRGATPAFKAVLTYPKGSYANIAKSVVTLPHSEFLEQSHIKTICTRVQFKEGKVPGEKCPAASIYGRAEAVTPLLSEPLKGPVYLRSSSHNLPDLVAALHNNQVDFALDGRIDSVKNGRIRNTFETVPDAPVSKFVLEMQGGKKGLLVNSTNLCKAKNHAISEFTGQNGKLHNTNPVLSAKCGGKGKKGKGKK